MYRLTPILALASLSALSQVPQQQSQRSYMNEGVAAFKSARYPQAVEAFQKAVAASPGDTNAHLYLATAYMNQFIPGSQMPQNLQFAFDADREFQVALNMDPDNMLAMQSLGILHFNLAQGAPPGDKTRELDEAARWYNRIVSAQPADASAHYSLGVIAWNKFYPELMRARQNLGMRPEDPGPLPDASARADLKGRMGPLVEDGMRHLERALEIDPAHDNAMAYLNLFYRERADLLDTAAEYQRDVKMADDFVHRALETKRAKAAQVAPGDGTTPQAPQSGASTSLAPTATAHSQPGGVISGTVAAAPAPVPPPVPPPGSQAPTSPKQIRVSGNVQSAKLIEQPPPEYPALARQARIQGIVRFNVIIGRDGAIANLSLISGHPLLVPAATEAVRRWRYQPTLLNGEPVEVVSVVDVNFTLTE